MSYHGVIGVLREGGMRRERIHSVEWKIPNFSSLHAAGGDQYESPDFDAFDQRWYLSIHPNGINSSRSNWVEVSLYRRVGYGCDPVTLNVRLSIKSAKGEENERERMMEFYKDDIECVLSYFCTRSDLEVEGRMEGGALTLSLRIERLLHAQAGVLTYKRKDSDRQKANIKKKFKGIEELQSSLQGLMKSEEDWDVVIKVQGKEFQAHRTILRARSEVLRAMFPHDMEKKGVVTMDDCCPETFPYFLKHVYTGSIEVISAKNVFCLYSASDKYDLKVLKKECSQFMKKNMSVTSFCKTIALAVRYSEKKLIKRATEFFCCYFPDIIKSAQWQKFCEENATVANELFYKTLIKA